VEPEGSVTCLQETAIGLSSEPSNPTNAYFITTRSVFSLSFHERIKLFSYVMIIRLASYLSVVTFNYLVRCLSACPLQPLITSRDAYALHLYSSTARFNPTEQLSRKL